jgi:sugar O-acyltransferase (sialic acid O-acetyltransferase NeuD family)
MKPLLLVGGGGHCNSCIDVIEAAAVFRIKGVVLAKLSSELVLGYPVIGTDDELPQLLESSKSVLITVGQIKNPDTRIRLFEQLNQLGAKLPVVVSPIAYYSKRSVIGDGSIIMHGAIVNAGAQVGKNCIVNSKALVEHDVVIGDHCHISTGARVNGNVTIGRGTFVGSGAVIKEAISLGENVTIGAGQIVLRDVPTGTVLKHTYVE